MTQDTDWDAIVIGSGFGGSPVAATLAAAGRSVLVVERGRWVDRDESAWDAKAILIDRKYQGSTPYEVDERWGRKLVYADDAVGGKSIFYGAASFRMRERDFAGADRFDGDSRSLPDMDWPIDYQDLSRYYDEAERRLAVAGVDGADPTEPRRETPYMARPPAYGRSARRIAEAAQALGFEPFPIPLAINYDADNGRAPCEKVMTCDLFPCKIGAKNDLAVTVLAEAQRRGAVVRDGSVATKLVRAGRRVSGVECQDIRSGRRFTERGKLVIVSCGAIPSAALLMRSGLQDASPGGRLIGRRLMRHCSGIVVGMFPFKTNPERQFHKQVALTDYYFGGPGRGPAGPWGMIQALQTPPPEYIRAASPYGSILGWIGAKTIEYQSFLLCLAEDLPNPENRIELDSSRSDPHGMPIARVFHRYSRRDLAARRALYRVAARILRKAGSLFRIRMPIHTYSHAVGTCRFGDDSRHAVLDPWCRVYGTDNLYVVDGSFFPSSGGVNPSLTIAANAFRVAHHLLERWD